MAAVDRKIDPTTLSVLWSRFDSLCEEIGERVIFGIQSFVMANVRDLGQVFLDHEGKIVSCSAYIPCHLFGAKVSVRRVIDKFQGTFEPGDFIMGNDSYLVASGHLPDWTFIRPAFYEDELIGFFQLRGHQSDTGGFFPGGYSPGAYDIIAEGLNIPAFKLMKAGKYNEEVAELLYRNIRNPEQVKMDNLLVNGACAKAEEGLVKLCDKYGVETVKLCMQEVLDVGEKAMRNEVAKLRDGVYYGERCSDWDGVTDKPVYVRCKATVKGDELIIDLSDSDPQCTFINSPVGNTDQSVMTGIYSIVDPKVPKNYGSMATNVTIITKNGTVVDPTYPATVGSCAISVGHCIFEAVQVALNQATTERQIGGSAKHCCPIQIGYHSSVIDPRTGMALSYWSETFASDGSAGGRNGYDGWTGIGTWYHMGSLLRPDIEHYEAHVPYVNLRYELLSDWEGAGEYRGGPGVYTEILCRTNPGDSAFMVSGNSDGMVMAPWGVAGGQEPPPVQLYMQSSGEERRWFRTMSQVPIKPGDILYTYVSGGGGYGDPLNRQADRVLKDVRGRLVSLERAREVYGVVIDAEAWTVDVAATEKLRKEKKAAKVAAGGKEP